MTVPIGVLHFSPLYWTDPEKFDPERLVSNFKIYTITGFHPVEVGASPSKKKEREREREIVCFLCCNIIRDLATTSYKIFESLNDHLKSM